MDPTDNPRWFLPPNRLRPTVTVQKDVPKRHIPQASTCTRAQREAVPLESTSNLSVREKACHHTQKSVACELTLRTTEFSIMMSAVGMELLSIECILLYKTPFCSINQGGEFENKM